MYADRELTEEVRKHEVLWGNCYIHMVSHKGRSSGALDMTGLSVFIADLLKTY